MGKVAPRNNRCPSYPQMPQDPSHLLTSTHTSGSPDLPQFEGGGTTTTAKTTAKKYHPHNTTTTKENVTPTTTTTTATPGTETVPHASPFSPCAAPSANTRPLVSAPMPPLLAIASTMDSPRNANAARSLSVSVESANTLIARPTNS